MPLPLQAPSRLPLILNRRCQFGFCTSCAAKTYQLFGRRNWLHSGGGPQSCRGLQCDGCRSMTPLTAVSALQEVLLQARLLSDGGAEVNAGNGTQADYGLLNTKVALLGLEKASLLMRTKVDGSDQTAQQVLLRIGPG